MPVRINDANTFTLSTAAVDGWIAERDEIKSQMEDLENRLNGVNAKLHAAFVLLPQLFEVSPSAEVSVDEAAGEEAGKTLLEHIVEIVAEKPMTPREIRGELEARDVLKPGSSSNYLYTMLSRGVQRGRLSRKGSDYAIPEQTGDKSLFDA